VAWLEQNLRLPALERAEAIVADRPPDAAGLTVLPLIAGERSPGWTEGARAVIAGLNLSTRSVDILQAAMEAVAYQLREVYDALSEAYGEPGTVIAAGAALARSSAWTQIIANVLEHQVIASRITETSSRGAAALALECLGVLELEAIDPLLGKIYGPEGADAYLWARRRQQELYDRLH